MILCHAPLAVLRGHLVWSFKLERSLRPKISSTTTQLTHVQYAMPHWIDFSTVAACIAASLKVCSCRHVYGAVSCTQRVAIEA